MSSALLQMLRIPVVTVILTSRKVDIDPVSTQDWAPLPVCVKSVAFFRLLIIPHDSDIVSTIGNYQQAVSTESVLSRHHDTDAKACQFRDKPYCWSTPKATPHRAATSACAIAGADQGQQFVKIEPAAQIFHVRQRQQGQRQRQDDVADSVGAADQDAAKGRSAVGRTRASTQRRRPSHPATAPAPP